MFWEGLRKVSLAALFLGSTMALGRCAAIQPHPCDELADLCKNPSIVKVETAMYCGFAGLITMGDEDNEAKCEQALKLFE